MTLVKSNRLLGLVRDFFKNYSTCKQPLLLGYSGGYDSELLLHLLIHLRKEFFFDLHLAHVDHGWRKESALQAKRLEQKAQILGCLFHLKTLKHKTTEEEARNLRLSFFQTLFEKYSFQALLLAHQKNDLAETVLKRFLEGAHFPLLYGMEERSYIGKMPIWRPLLRVAKKEIYEAVEENHLEVIDDASNRDTSYLRARMRREILPILERKFGKSIMQNLFQASYRACELRQYLDGKTDKAYRELIHGPLGVVLPRSSWSSLEKLEKSHLLKRIVSQQQISLSRPALEQLLLWSETKKTPRCLRTKNALFVLDRGDVFIQTKPFVPFVGEIQLKEGTVERGCWKVTLFREEAKKEERRCWKDVWENKSFLFLPWEVDYTLSLPQPGSYCISAVSLKKLWEKEKIPSFMRNHIPVIYQKGKVVGDFLSGKILLPCKGPCLKVSLEMSFF